MKILHLATPYVAVDHTLGGAVQRRIREMAAAQAVAGSSVTIVGPTNTSGERLQLREDVELLEVRSGPRLRDAVAYLTSASMVARRQNPDIVHVHGLALSKLLLGDLPALLQVDYTDYYRRVPGRHHVVERALDRYPVIAGVSEYSIREAARRWRLHPDRTAVLHNGCRVKLEQRLQRPGSRLTVGYLGRICPQKGSDVYATSAANVLERRTTVDFLAAGPLASFATGQDEDTFAQARALLGPAVCYLGVLRGSRRALPRRLRCGRPTHPPRRDVRHGCGRGDGSRVHPRGQRLRRPPRGRR